jgi:hypothetical protein
MILSNDCRYEVLKNMRPFFRDVRIMDVKKHDDEHYLFQVEHIYKPMTLILDVMVDGKQTVCIILINFQDYKSVAHDNSYRFNQDLTNR